MRASRSFPVRPRQKAKKKKVAPLDPHIASRLCAYCRKAPGVTRDHVVPKSFLGRELLPDELRATVACCLGCNINKANRALVPESWRDKIPALDEAYPSRKWRVWNGDLRSRAFAAAWQ